MRYEKSEEVIYKTTDYDGFVFTDWNRDVTPVRVAKMVNSIKKYGWLPEPVLVNERFEVIDGQSRVKALEKCGLPVEFIVKGGVGMEECKALNLFQQNWGIEDFIDSYVAERNRHYIWLRQLVDEYRGLGKSIVCSIACFPTEQHSGQYADIIKNGDFKVSEQNKVEIKGMCTYLERFSEPFKRVKGHRAVFFSALRFIYRMDGVDKERLLRVVTQSAEAHTLASCDTTEGWLINLQELYNKNLKKIDKKYFVHEYEISK